MLRGRRNTRHNILCLPPYFPGDKQGPRGKSAPAAAPHCGGGLFFYTQNPRAGCRGGEKNLLSKPLCVTAAAAEGRGAFALFKALAHRAGQRRGKHVGKVLPE